MLLHSNAVWKIVNRYVNIRDVAISEWDIASFEEYVNVVDEGAGVLEDNIALLDKDLNVVDEYIIRKS